jgi:hypothetical protein
MKKIILLVAFNIPLIVWAQGTRQVPDPVVNNQFGYLTQVPPKPADVVGSVYLNENWKEATVNLKKATLGIEKLAGINMKLDLKTNTLELQTDKDIKVLGGSNVESFAWMNDLQSKEVKYVNCDKFSFDGTKLHGFGRVLAEGNKLSLIQHQYLEFIKADYNLALDVGSKDHKYVKREKLYFLKNGQLIPASKKAMQTVMSDKKQEVSKYAKEQKLNLKEESGLAAVVEYYNTL